MLRNQRRNLSLLRGCDSFDAFTQLDVEYALHDDDCYMPQQHENVLVKLHVEYPDSVFILNNRNPLRWATSVRDWQMSRRFVECNFTEPRILMSDVYLTAWYRRHQTFIRNFAKVYHHRLIEVDIENATSYHELASAANISLSCVSHSNAQVHKPRRVCWVGDSIIRNLACMMTAFNGTCHQHAYMRMNELSHFFWAPTLAAIEHGEYSGCDSIVWNNLYHQVRDASATFDSVRGRKASIMHTHGYLTRFSTRVVFFFPAPPTGEFAHEAHENSNISMLHAWYRDRDIVSHSTEFLFVRGDLVPYGHANDGRHYDDATLRHWSVAVRNVL